MTLRKPALLLRAGLLLVCVLSPRAFAQEPAAPWRDQRAINEAIDRGIEHLIRRQARDGSWGPTPLRDEAHFDQRNGLTALALYTLLKCDLPRTHPVVRRAEAFLLQGFPRTTYAISAQLQALSALDPKTHRERIEELAELVMSFQISDLLVWGYPTHAAVRYCLSNTQYAVLGLRAAQQAGVKVPTRVWERTIEGVFDFQEAVRRVDTANGPLEIAGFSYDRIDPKTGKIDRGHAVSGSMTAAGVAILSIADQGLEGAMRKRMRQRFEPVVERGLAWLGHHFAVDHNPGGSASWHYYYLYGLERVGALRGLASLGEHDWYWEGARELIKLQAADGEWRRPGETAWPPEPMGGANTCFALLFLVRATGPTSGVGASAGIWALEGPEQVVKLRASGRGKLAVWISGFSDETLEAHSEGLLIREVAWIVDGEEVRCIEGDPTKAWKNERFALQHPFGTAGSHTVEARVSIDGSLSEGASEGELRSGELVVEASDVIEGWMLDYAEESGQSIWKEGRLKVTASSQLDNMHGPGRAIDGLQFTSWMPKPDDAQPTLKFRFSRGMRAARMAFSQAGGSEREGLGAVRRLALRFGGSRHPVEVELDPDPNRKTYFELPRNVRTWRELELRVIEHSGEGAYGLAEVELFED